MQLSLLKGFYLRELLIEPASGMVSGPNGDGHLPPKAVALLLYLAEQPFTLIERDELLRAVWGPGQGSQEALSHTISELRNALDDHADNPRFIQTLPKRGYRLLQAPRLLEDAKSALSNNRAGASPESSFLNTLMRRGVVQAGIAYGIFGGMTCERCHAHRFGGLTQLISVGTSTTECVHFFQRE